MKADRIESSSRRPKVKTFIQPYGSNSQAALVNTDDGRFVIKAPNNRDGPRVLVAEWVASQAARWLGAPVPDFAIVDHSGVVNVPLGEPGAALAAPGPCFGSAWIRAQGWEGGRDLLDSVENLRSIPVFVVVDTWLINLDRYTCDVNGVERFNNPRNFLLADGKARGKLRLVAIDFGHALGGPALPLSNLAQIGHVKDDTIYGCFPSLQPYLRRELIVPVVERLRTVNADVARGFLDGIPAEWSLTPEDGAAVADFLQRRASYVADRFEKLSWPGDALYRSEGEE